MPDSTYATFRERNQWEAETWRWYIPIEGNETALAALRALVDRTGESYHLDLTPLAERDVDARVAAPSATSYLWGHNKLTGRLVVPSLESLRERWGARWADDVLYKGQWVDTFLVAEEADDDA